MNPNPRDGLNGPIVSEIITLVTVGKNLWADGQPVSEATCGSWAAAAICIKAVLMSTLIYVHVQLQTVSMVRIPTFWPSGTLYCLLLLQSLSAVVTAQARIVALGIRKMPHSQEPR